MAELNRRDFLATATFTAAGVALCGCQVAGTGRASQPQGKGPLTGPLDVGPLKNYRSERLVDRFAKSDHVLLVSESGRLFALSAVCTHRHCVVQARQDDLVCPCHGSTFTPEGAVTRGPARRALPRLAVSVNAAGHVIVDRSHFLAPEQENAPGAFIML
jgi:cytochrome b6-f complex iron-sulfur subunit